MKKSAFLPIPLWFPLVLFLCGTVLSCTGCAVTDASLPPEHSGIVTDIPSPTPVFRDFATDIFVEEITSDTLSLRYSLSHPESYGITDYPITLGSVRDAVTPDDNTVSLYEQLLGYDPETLYEEDYLTYLSLKDYLELALLNDFSPYLSELLGPTTGYQAQLPIVLAEYRFDTREDIEHYLALLPCIYDYFTEIAEFERQKSAAGYFMNDETAETIIAQCNDFVRNVDEHFLIHTFEERLEGLDLSLSEKTEYILKNRTALHTYVFPSYELLAETLTQCLGTGQNNYGLAYLEDGKDYYALLTRLNTGSSKSMEELKERLSSAISESFQTMSAALTQDPAIYENALAPDDPETDPELIISYVTTKSSGDFPFVDCGNCTIKSIPASLQDYVSPAMYLVPPMDDYETGVIYINQNPRYDLDALFPTIVHEGYPGHLYQTVASLSTELHPLRYLLASTGYEEGWATYVETYCYKYAGFSDALTSFLQADQIATLCLYALSDIFIHYDGYTPEQLSTFLTGYGFTKEAAALIYQTLLSEPGAYLPYAVGYLEFSDLKKLAESLWAEEYSDYAFHEFLLEMGPLPFSILENLLTNPHLQISY